LQCKDYYLLYTHNIVFIIITIDISAHSQQLNHHLFQLL